MSAAPALPSAPGTQPEAALDALPAADPGRSPLHAAKERNQQKLERARELLAAAQSAQLPGTALPDAQLFSTPPSFEPLPAEDIWQTAPQQAVDETGPQWLVQPQVQAQPQADFTASLPDLSALPEAPAYPPAYSPVADLPVAPAPEPTTNLPFIPAPAPAPDLPVTPAPAPMADLPVAPPPVALVEQTVGTGFSTKAAKVVKVVDFARAQIGKPCLSGAAGPGAYDCSGLTQAAWKAAGVALPRTPQAQASVGTVIPLTELREGDLVFFHDDLSHVGVYTGNGMMVHAPGPGSSIREEPVLSVGESAIRGAVRTV
ncbi:peptidoglycan endopeptidase [Streptomyces lincolnensis]|nr:peptidoglycan endopeptidase [Streptomyces lincolnensis]